MGKAACIKAHQRARTNERTQQNKTWGKSKAARLDLREYWNYLMIGSAIFSTIYLSNTDDDDWWLGNAPWEGSAVIVEGTHEFYFVDLISHERENLHSQLLHLSFDVLFIIDCTLSMLSF